MRIRVPRKAQNKFEKNHFAAQAKILRNSILQNLKKILFSRKFAKRQMCNIRIPSKHLNEQIKSDDNLLKIICVRGVVQGLVNNTILM